ncbi:MAG: hypothetical protein PUH70_07560 [Clostridiales bacterium]|nr:hypothetical protein [Clostridiales bacterium]MDY5515194.1 hypothetical protein [Candidatus Ventricola sp.]
MERKTWETMGRGAKMQPLGEAEQELLRRGYELFERFRIGLTEAHDEMRRARMIRQLRQDERSGTAPAGNTLGSCVDNAIADQIDNLPEAQLLPEREETARSAEEMSDVVSYVLYHAGWPGKYQTIMEDAVVTGTGVAEVFWDAEAEDGEGMVGVLAWHPEDFYPDPAVENLQDGRACFKVTHTTVDWVEAHYPHARGYVGEDRSLPWQEGLGEDAPQDDARTTLIEFWYKRYDAESRCTRVHMAQMAGGALLYSTELGFGGADKAAYADGVYAHGQYPFTLYKFRHVWRRPFGTGLIHDYRETQSAIDRYTKYIDDNARQSSIQRHFIRRGSGINAEDVADMRKTIIEWEGSDIREVLQTVQAQPLNGQVYEMLTYLADSMKQDCGQNQFTRGEAGLGVTAASAIEALQNAGNKITRWHTEIFKDAFREMVEQIIWVLSEYLEPGRTLRIVGGWDSTGQMRDRLVTLIAPGAEGAGLMRPAYAVRVQVQKNNPMQIQADNEFLQQVVEVCAKAGQPMPPETVVRLMEGYRTKNSVLAALEESSRTAQRIAQLEAENEALRKGVMPLEAEKTTL